MQTEVLETRAHDGRLLRIEFLWHVDRYRHVISAVDASGAAVPLLESVEGSPTDTWPTSPPLQSLHIETQPDGRRVALLVGMAGRSHWSASIGPDAPEEWLVFDIACRAAQADGQAASHYRSVSRIQLVEEAEVLSLPFGNFELIVARSTKDGPPTILQTTASMLRVAPRHDSDGKPTPTRRWLYRLKLSDA